MPKQTPKPYLSFKNDWNFNAEVRLGSFYFLYLKQESFACIGSVTEYKMREVEMFDPKYRAG